MRITFWSKNLNERKHLGDLDVDEKIILKWSQRNRVWRCGLDSFGKVWSPMAGSCENGNEYSI